MRDELVERNVATVVRGPASGRDEVKPWTPTEAGAFLAAAAGDRLYALFAVGVALGLRRGELLGLRRVDVDLDQRMLRVRQSIQRFHGVGLIIGPPKSRRSIRDIPLPAYVVQVLAEHLDRQGSERAEVESYWQDCGLVFTTTIGTAIEPRNLLRLLDQLIVKAGVRRIRFHDLRHTCASLLLAQGVPRAW